MNATFGNAIVGALARLLRPLGLGPLAGADPELQCGNRKWLPYEDADGFGYCEWVCDLEPGHVGDHGGWLPDLDRP